MECLFYVSLNLKMNLCWENFSMKNENISAVSFSSRELYCMVLEIN